MLRPWILALALAVCGVATVAQEQTWSAGVGQSDVTAACSGIAMGGYWMLSHVPEGIHFRLWSRAFIFATGGERVAFVTVDTPLMFEGIKREVIPRLQEMYGDLYREDNVVLTATHTHSGPGGLAQMFLYDLPTLGFYQEQFDSVVGGIVESIVKAHEGMVDNAQVYLKTGHLSNAGISRAITSYRLNPEDERDEYDSEYTNEFTLLRVNDAEGRDMGMLTWLGTHATAMNNTGRLISGDNKGYASLLMEEWMNPTGTLPGQGEFVAAFANSNGGDVSPNTLGALCPDGTPCSPYTSQCLNPNWPEERPREFPCRGVGIGENPQTGEGSHYETTRLIGENQATYAMELYRNVSDADLLTPELSFVHHWVSSFKDFEVSAEYTQTGQDEHLCSPAVGASTAAGATDGQGATILGFHQGANQPDDNIILRTFLAELTNTVPTEEEIACQAPKPMLARMGAMNFPRGPWSAVGIPTQILKLGRLWIPAIPFEVTTMAGRRIVRSMMEKIDAAGLDEEAYIVLAGYSNSFNHYSTTYQEYQAQRYEAASTHWGPHQTAALRQIYAGLAESLANGNGHHPGVAPLECNGHPIEECRRGFLPGVVRDDVPTGVDFGDVVEQPDRSYTVGDTAEAVFWAGNPRNDHRRGSSFLYVEQAPEWEVVATDGNWETKFHWGKVEVDNGDDDGLLNPYSQATLSWDIPQWASGETFRFRYKGNKRNLVGIIQEIEGVSDTFTVA